MYNLTADYSKRLRAQLIKASSEVELARLQQGLRRLVAHIDNAYART